MHMSAGRIGEAVGMRVKAFGPGQGPPLVTEVAVRPQRAPSAADPGQGPAWRTARR